MFYNPDLFSSKWILSENDRHTWMCIGVFWGVFQKADF